MNNAGDMIAVFVSDDDGPRASKCLLNLLRLFRKIRFNNTASEKFVNLFVIPESTMMYPSA